MTKYFLTLILLFSPPCYSYAGITAGYTEIDKAMMVKIPDLYDTEEAIKYANEHNKDPNLIDTLLALRKKEYIKLQNAFYSGDHMKMAMPMHDIIIYETMLRTLVPKIILAKPDSAMLVEIPDFKTEFEASAFGRSNKGNQDIIDRLEEQRYRLVKQLQTFLEKNRNNHGMDREDNINTFVNMAKQASYLWTALETADSGRGVGWIAGSCVVDKGGNCI